VALRTLLVLRGWMLVEDQQELGFVGLADFAKAAEQSPHKHAAVHLLADPVLVEVLQATEPGYSLNRKWHRNRELLSNPSAFSS
jgi:hypothetical protein